VTGVRISVLLAVLHLLGALPAVVEAAFVRANCRGVQEFSMTGGKVSCQESSVLDNDSEHLLLGHTRATASLARGLLIASAAGGQIRGVGSNGGEAGALFMDRLTITGDWDGFVSVTVRLCVAYKFAGFGESRIHATLRTSSVNSAAGDNRARVRLSHRGFGAAALADFDSRGEFEIPRQGSHPLQSNVVLSVTEKVHRNSPEMNLRADIGAFALPNLEALEPVLSSFGKAVAWISVSLPERLAFSSESGMFMGEPYTHEAMGFQQGAKPSWVIMTAANIGKTNALRSNRGWYRVVARSDCRHQFVLDG
jgi:hypothetical protein